MMLVAGFAASQVAVEHLVAAVVELQAAVAELAAYLAVVAEPRVVVAELQVAVELLAAVELQVVELLVASLLHSLFQPILSLAALALRHLSILKH